MLGRCPPTMRCAQGWALRPSRRLSTDIRRPQDTFRIQFPEETLPSLRLGWTKKYYVAALLRSRARGAVGLPRHRTRPGPRRDVARLADQPIDSGASGSRGRDILPRYLWRTLSTARTGAVSGRRRAGAGGILVGWLASI